MSLEKHLNNPSERCIEVNVLKGSPLPEKKFCHCLSLPDQTMIMGVFQNLLRHVALYHPVKSEGWNKAACHCYEIPDKEEVMNSQRFFF